MRSQLILALICASVLVGTSSGCSSVVRRDLPSIAHIHIGHAITGWPLAPKKQGLLVVAELSSISAAANSELMLQTARDRDFAKARKYLIEVANDVDPTLVDSDATEAYGFRRAAAEASTHLELASEVDDASANVQRTVTQTNVKAGDIIDRSDELIAFIDAGLRSTDVAELEIIAEEINRTLIAIAGGPDINSYGLFEFREDIESMVAREDPPYQTVDTWYLFNLVKLPDGKWGFASRSSRGAAGLGY